MDPIIVAALITAVAPTIASLAALWKVIQADKNNIEQHKDVETRLLAVEMKTDVVNQRLMEHVKWEETDKWDALLGSVKALGDRMQAIERREE